MLTWLELNPQHGLWKSSRKFSWWESEKTLYTQALRKTLVHTGIEQISTTSWTSWVCQKGYRNGQETGVYHITGVLSLTPPYSKSLGTLMIQHSIKWPVMLTKSSPQQHEMECSSVIRSDLQLEGLFPIQLLNTSITSHFNSKNQVFQSWWSVSSERYLLRCVSHTSDRWNIFTQMADINPYFALLTLSQVYVFHGKKGAVSLAVDT